jgi:hypothetical protein
MNNRLQLSLCLAIASFTIGSTLAWSQSAVPVQTQTGYLTPAEMPDVVRIVPAAPVTGDSRYTADMAIFSRDALPPTLATMDPGASRR